MKKLFILLLLLCCFRSRAQYVTIPDPNFVAWLQTFTSAMVGNQMDTTDASVTGLTNINISNNNIGDLTGIQYFSSLQQLSCDLNQLTFLPNLPNSLLFLYCCCNQLTSLPNLPPGLLDLACEDNQLTSLPALPSSLDGLQCNDNFLTGLPVLPNGLSVMYCHSNNISCFPVFPNSITNLSIDPNPYDCLPNYITAMNSTQLATPLCDSGNTNGCPIATIGIIDIAGKKIISIYPNPANEFLNVETKLLDAESKIYDVLGNEIRKEKFTAKTQLKVSDLTDGIYFIQVSTSFGVLSKKIIIQH